MRRTSTVPADATRSVTIRRIASSVGCRFRWRSRWRDTEFQSLMVNGGSLTEADVRDRPLLADCRLCSPPALPATRLSPTLACELGDRDKAVAMALVARRATAESLGSWRRNRVEGRLRAAQRRSTPTAQHRRPNLLPMMTASTAPSKLATASKPAIAGCLHRAFEAPRPSFPLHAANAMLLDESTHSRHQPAPIRSTVASP